MFVLFAETEAGKFRQILKGHLDFESEPWPGISESAKDLISKMLNGDPKKRFTAHEVLCKTFNQTYNHLKNFSQLVLLQKQQFFSFCQRTCLFLYRSSMDYG